MPRITCPNCGTTINLENRKRIDFDMIVRATKKKPRTFTELLHITRLPRKTLSLRLKEMCVTGSLTKRDRVYKSNGASTFENITIGPVKGLSRIFQNGRTRTGFVLIMLLICFSTSGYVLAMFFPLPSIKEGSQEPVIIGTFAMDLNVNNVKDLYAWQAFVVYNSSELKVLEILPGRFVGAEYPLLNATDVSKGIFMNATDIGAGRLLLGGSLAGKIPGKNGSGRLAKIVFGYLMGRYETPEISLTNECFETLLLNSQGYIIPLEDSTLTLNLVK